MDDEFNGFPGLVLVLHVFVTARMSAELPSCTKPGGDHFAWIEKGDIASLLRQSGGAAPGSTQSRKHVRVYV